MGKKKDAPLKESSKKGKDDQMRPTVEAKRKPKEATALENAKTPEEIMAERHLQELRSKIRKQVSAAVIQYPFVGRNMKFELDEERIFLRIYSDGRFIFRRPTEATSTRKIPLDSVLMDTFEGVMRNFKEWEEYLEGVTDADSTTAEIDLQAILRITEAWPKSWNHSATVDGGDQDMHVSMSEMPLRRVRTVAVEEVCDVIHFAIVPFFKPEYAVLSEDVGAGHSQDTILGPRKGSRVPPKRLQLGLTVATVAGEEPETTVWLPCTGADAVFPGPSKQKSFPSIEFLGTRRLTHSMSMNFLDSGGASGKRCSPFDLSAQQERLPRFGVSMGPTTRPGIQLGPRLQSDNHPSSIGKLGGRRRHQLSGMTVSEQTQQKDRFLNTVIDSLRPEVQSTNQLLRKTFSAPKDLTEQLSILKPLEAKRGPGADFKGRGAERFGGGSDSAIVAETWGRSGYSPIRQGPRVLLGAGNQVSASLPSFGLLGAAQHGQARAVPNGTTQYRPDGQGKKDWSAYYKNRTEEFLRRLSAS